MTNDICSAPVDRTLTKGRYMIGNSCCIRQPAVSLASLALVLLVAMPRAQAALGETAASVPVDQARLEATLRSVPSSKFTVHEMKTSGATVREYVSPAGVVFGVAWEGPTLPDLRQLLGSYFGSYVDAMSARHTRRAPVMIELPGLAVHASGHMRAFAGQAYLPQSVPPGVVVEDLR